MIPYFFAAGRTNYARWAPVYVLNSMHLPEEMKTALSEGQFSVRQTAGRFNGIPSDMGTEKTVIKDLKGKGGILKKRSHQAERSFTEMVSD